MTAKTITSLDQLHDSELYQPAEIAALFPTRNARFVREQCADGHLDYVPGAGRGGKPTYWIPGSAVKAWRRRNEVRAA